eukprot:9332995-Alexandrium_andersonii.AAC.1
MAELALTVHSLMLGEEVADQPGLTLKVAQSTKEWAEKLAFIPDFGSVPTLSDLTVYADSMQGSATRPELLDRQK